MDKFVISGGARLSGEVVLSGSKNACLPIFAATLLARGKSVIRNVPHLSDIFAMISLLESLGAKVDLENDAAVIDTSCQNRFEAKHEIVRKMRASFWVLGPLLVKFGKARVPLPGGCAIGARPIDMHLMGFSLLGVSIKIDGGYVEAEIGKKGLSGNTISLNFASVGATQHLMLAAAMIPGETIIKNAAMEPEVVEVARALRSMGAALYGEGTSILVINGKKKLAPLCHTVSSDRIECGTFIALSAATRGDILLKNANLSSIDSVVNKFTEAGCGFLVEKNGDFDSIRISGPEKLKSCNIETSPFPGFPTDMQAQFMACMATADGVSRIEETIFENRFMHVSELLRMGANISLSGNFAIVKGVRFLKFASVTATDLRASASLIIAALVAEGESEVFEIHHLDRGYFDLEKKISNIGGVIKRVSS